MTASSLATPILLLGAGRMGGALIEGWRRAAAFAPSDLILCDPHPGPDALKAEVTALRAEIAALKAPKTPRKGTSTASVPPQDAAG